MLSIPLAPIISASYISVNMQTVTFLLSSCYPHSGLFPFSTPNDLSECSLIHAGSFSFMNCDMNIETIVVNQAMIAYCFLFSYLISLGKVTVFSGFAAISLQHIITQEKNYLSITNLL